MPWNNYTRSNVRSGYQVLKILNGGMAMTKKHMLNRMIKFSAMALTAGLACFGTSKLNAQAAPEVMPDGTIFDADYYAASNPDVAANYGTDTAALYNHYKLYGYKEGRLPFLGSNVKFDPVYYASTYPDVLAVYGLDSVALYKHYIMTGIFEGRFPNADEAKKAADAAKKASQQSSGQSSSGSGSSDEVIGLTTDDAAYINSVFSYINDSRENYGILSKPLELSPALNAVAKVRLGEIKEDFSHIRANHMNYGSAIRDAGISYTYEGECISHANTLRDTINYWHGTPEEWNMLLDGNFKKVGIAAGDGYCVAIFIG